jgi:hypothetical protein
MAATTARDIPTERPITIAEGDDAAGWGSACEDTGVAVKGGEEVEGVVIGLAELMAVAELVVDV